MLHIDCIEESLLATQRCYEAQLQSDLPLLQKIHQYLMLKSGKMIRPALMLLSAGTCDEEHRRPLQQQIQLAAALEMLHNASLIHDDVVDKADSRRGQPSLNNHWGNKVAVLVGDFYMAQTSTLMDQAGDEEASRLMNRTVLEMTQGELMQMQDYNCHEASAERYLDIIRRKTAELMCTCCTIGNPLLKDFGMHFGMAFQLRDDIDDGEDNPCTAQQLEIEKQAALDELATMQPSIYINELKKLIKRL